ncbi:MAG: hypothetical protein WEA56_15800 [Balneolaceae bacterium]
MLIGGNFNNKCKKLLVETGLLSGMEPGKNISVQDLNKNLEFDRTELRGYLEHLSDQGYISLTTIGGPFLYGHISLTKRGLYKLEEFQK